MYQALEPWQFLKIIKKLEQSKIKLVGKPY